MKKLHYTCTQNDIDNRIDFILKNVFPELGGRGIKKLCEQNKIILKNKPIKASYKAKEHDEIQIILENSSISQVENLIPLCSSHGYIAIYKAPFLHTESQQGKITINIEDSIKNSFPNAILLTRLDYATSGLILFCQNTIDFENWKKEQAQNTIKKRYLALVEGNIQQPFSIQKEIIAKNTTTMQTKQGTKTRTTLITPLAISACQQFSLIECTIFQGARHQIRVHLASEGFPLVGDIKYGARTQNFAILHQLELCNNNLTHSISPTLSKTTPYLELLEKQQSEKFILHNYQIQSPFITAHCLPPFWEDLPKTIQDNILVKIQHI